MYKHGKVYYLAIATTSVYMVMLFSMLVGPEKSESAVQNRRNAESNANKD
jgi:hypothetical protein